MDRTLTLSAKTEHREITITIPEDSGISDVLNSIVVILQGLTFYPSTIKQGICELAEEYKDEDSGNV